MDNARIIKKVLVEDNVHFEQIDFPKEVDNIKLTVLEVFRVLSIG
ncbi:hypothetical protein [Spirochaeta cellobiosiphila]|nr:hypothetical protein [Spirochaeta cellobiosiphila]